MKLRRRFNPDTLLFADPHLHDRKEFSKLDTETSLGTRFLEGLDILWSIKYDIIDKGNIRFLILLGDVFELKDRVPNHMLSEFKAWLDELSGNVEQFYILRGNHDFNLVNYTTLDTMRDSFTLIDTDTRISLDNYNVYFIPYQRDFSKFIEMWKTSHLQKGIQAVFFHQTIGGVYDNGREVSLGTWEPFYHPQLLYLAGDLHIPQKVGQVQYLGSPYPTKFGTISQDHYVWLLDRNTNQLSKVQLKYSKFIDVDLVTDIASEGVYNAKDNYVRICGEIDIETWKTFDRKAYQEALEKAGAKGVTWNVTITRPRQIRMEIKDKTDEFILEKYASDQAPKTLKLHDVIDFGKDLWGLCDFNR